MNNFFETELLNYRMKRRALPAALFFLTSAVSAACSNHAVKSNHSASQQKAINQNSIAQSSEIAISSQDSLKARIAILRSPSAYYLAKVKGTLEQQLKTKNFAVEWLGPFPAFSPAVEAMNAGSVDFTVGSTTAAISAMAANSPFKIFGYQVSGSDGSGILVQKNSDIKTVKDLVGKKVIVNRGGTGEYLLAKALETEGIPLEQVQRVYLGPADAAPVFASNKADAWAVWGTFFATAVVQYQARILATAGKIGSENDVIYIVHNAFLEKHPNIVKTVYDVLLRESQWSLANADEVMQIYGKEFKLPTPIQKFMSKRMEGAPTPVSTTEIEKMKRVSDWFYKKRIIPNKPVMEKFVVDIRSV